MINKFYLLCVIFSGSPDLTLKTCLVLDRSPTDAVNLLKEEGKINAIIVAVSYSKVWQYGAQCTAMLSNLSADIVSFPNITNCFKTQGLQTSSIKT